MKFRDVSEFPERLGQFLERLDEGTFKPRDYILDNLTLEKCTRKYLDIAANLPTLRQ
jgi:hypothetical protein